MESNQAEKIGRRCGKRLRSQTVDVDIAHSHVAVRPADRAEEIDCDRVALLGGEVDIVIRAVRVPLRPVLVEKLVGRGARAGMVDIDPRVELVPPTVMGIDHVDSGIHLPVGATGVIDGKCPADVLAETVERPARLVAPGATERLLRGPGIEGSATLVGRGESVR